MIQISYRSLSDRNSQRSANRSRRSQYESSNFETNYTLKQGRRIDSGMGNPLHSLTVSSPVPPFSLSTFLSADFEQSTLAERIYLS